MRKLLIILLTIMLVSCTKDYNEDEIQFYEMTQPKEQEVILETKPITPEITKDITNIYETPIIITDILNNKVILNEKPLNVAILQVNSFVNFLTQFLNNDINYANFSINYEVENIFNLEPDLIICSSENLENYYKFRDSGIPTIALNPINDYTDTYDYWITLLGDIFNEQEKSRALIEKSNNTIELIETRLEQVEEIKDGIIIYNYYSYGDFRVETGDYYGQFIFDSVKINNIAYGYEINEGDMKDIIDLNPELVYITQSSSYTAEDLLNDNINQNHIWSKTIAGVNGDIYDDTSNLYSFSPNMPISLLSVACTIYPHLFEDFDLENIFSDFTELF